MSYLVQQVLKYSDGSETIVNFKPNADSQAIEEASAELVAEHSEVTGTAPIEGIVADPETLSSTEDVLEEVEEKPKRKKKVSDED